MDSAYYLLWNYQIHVKIMEKGFVTVDIVVRMAKDNFLKPYFRIYEKKIYLVIVALS
jgi:hypothetical protein